jgi:hypothetical protein
VLLIRVLNIGIAVTGILVLIGWLRHRSRDDYRDIRASEVSPDLLAGEELLEDALTAENRSRTELPGTHPAMPGDPAN